MRGRLVTELNPYWPVLAALFGLLFGSFLNVCIYRLPRDLSVVAPRSFCPECGLPIAWYDNIPLGSFLRLRGRARCCGSPIALRYPLVEFLTAFAFCAVALRFGFSWATLKWLLFEALLIALFWTDLEERILPDEMTLGGTLAGLLLAWFVPVPSLLAGLFFPNLAPAAQSLVNAALGAFVLAAPLWLLAFLYERIRKREGLGLGDLKLLLLLGVFLGVEQALAALLIGAVLGTVVGLIFILVKRREALTYALPFGSFLCAAAALIPFLRYTIQGFGGG